MLIFEADPTKHALEIYADEEGIGELRRALDFLLQGEPHTHLFSPVLGGPWSELSSEPLQDGDIVYHDVTLIRAEPLRSG